MVILKSNNMPTYEMVPKHTLELVATKIGTLTLGVQL